MKLYTEFYGVHFFHLYALFFSLSFASFCRVFFVCSHLLCVVRTGHLVCIIYNVIFAAPWHSFSIVSLTKLFVVASWDICLLRKCLRYKKKHIQSLDFYFLFSIFRSFDFFVVVATLVSVAACFPSDTFIFCSPFVFFFSFHLMRCATACIIWNREIPN